ncbi:glycosyltransferase family 4 protein [Photobacterium sanguinicancri]|uniref:glycosyltransferase family 4 protein n=1 Tax=Photobacterium sanguinicancri TaxID=875932 RepID=UPI0021C37152|nr:glycosyltransferase family 4 protein [Photobacterium sanguinicancri]
MSNKKLLIVTTVPDTLHGILAGQPKYLNDYFDVELASSNNDFADKVIKTEGRPFHVVPMVRGINPFYDIYSIFCMIRLLILVRPDVVHSYTPKAGLITMISSWLCRTPNRVHTFTGLIFPTATGFKKKLLITIDQLICFCATVVVPEGQGVKTDLLDYNVTTKSLNVIGNGNVAGVDLSYFSPSIKIGSESLSIRNQLGISSESLTFCFIGRLNKDKGVEELIDAFECLEGTAHLIVVGDLDSSQPIADSLMTRLASNQKVHMVGYQSDIRPYLDASDVLILPSYREGFPNVLLQAGAMGLPCIATNINGCNEIIDNKNGWLVEPRNSDSLLAAMSAAAHCQNYSDMSANARENVEEKFERSNYLELLLKFYKKECNHD